MDKMTSFDVEARADARLQVMRRDLDSIEESLGQLNKILDGAERAGVRIDTASIAKELKAMHLSIRMIENEQLRDLYLVIYAPIIARLDRMSGVRSA